MFSMNIARSVLLTVVLAAAGPASDWSSPQRVDVVMNDYHFVPDHLTLRYGTVYRLHLVNHGKELHEFTAPAFFAAATMRDPRVLIAGGTEVSVEPGGTVDVDFIPRQVGRFTLICADHDWAGMVGYIVVE